MPVPYQIVPDGSLFRPKIETHINDNTEVLDTYDFSGGTATSGLFVFTSPKGRDGKVITIKNGLGEFMEEYGLGPFSVYGQPLINAYAAARAATGSNAMIHCLRVTAPDAMYSNAILYAKYKFEGDEGSKVMKIGYVVKATTGLSDLADLEDLLYTDVPTSDTWTYQPVAVIAYRGKGTYGKNLRFRITSDRASDKYNKYVNYMFSVYRNETFLEQLEGWTVSFVEDAYYSGASMYVQDIVNSDDNGSKYVSIAVDPSAVPTMYAAYMAENPDSTFTVDDFDPLLGNNKYTKGAIDNLEIVPSTDTELVEGKTDEFAVSLNDPLCIPLQHGTDGSFDPSVDETTRTASINAEYLKAFQGKIDPNIMSKNRYPTTFIPDANYPHDIKRAIVALMQRRTDCMAVLDFGTEIHTKGSVAAVYNDESWDTVSDRNVVFEPYCMKVRDPYSKKSVVVTSTYWLIPKYFQYIDENGGKHRPLAGNRFGIISGYIPNSIYPLFDDDLDAEMLDELADMHCNVAKYNQNQVAVRSMQNTSQHKLSSLTEMNNVLVLLDIKRDCEALCAQIEYEFVDPANLALFNMSLETITNKYADAQVKSISARFDQNDWERDRSIIHLYVEMVCRDLIKTTIIEIDVNRSNS